MTKLVLSTTIALLLLTTGGYADWQGTKWGMSETQVKAALGGSVELDGNCTIYPPDPSAFSIRVRYAVGQFSFRSCLNGNTASGLSKVVAILQSPDSADALKDELTAKYGTPVSAGKVGGFVVVEWRSAGDKIVLSVGVTSIGPITSVTYTPIDKAYNKGL